jgi:hypothetical protein
VASFNAKDMKRQVLADDPRVDPNLLKALKEAGMDVPGPVLPLDSQSPHEAKLQLIKLMETAMQLLLNGTVSQLKPIETVSSTTISINGTDGNTISLYMHSPIRLDSSSSPLPCIYHIHGGAMTVLQVVISLFLICALALSVKLYALPCVIFYRVQMNITFDGGPS